MFIQTAVHDTAVFSITMHNASIIREKIKKILGTIALLVATVILFGMTIINTAQIKPAPPSEKIPAREISRIPPAPTTPIPTAPPPSAAPAKTQAITPPPRPLKWGFYESSFDVQKILNLEKTIGKSPDHIAVFIHWGNENKFPTYLAPAIKDRGKTLVIFWEATDYTRESTEQPTFSYDAILQGSWDAYMKSFAADAKSYGAPIILIPFSEMNGDWFPWSGTKNGNTPTKMIQSYRRVHDIFADAHNVKFGFAPNNESTPNTPENSLDKYYPGDAYVDYVGIDGFNFGNPWKTFDEMFSAPLAVLATYNKPIYIFSFASAEGENKAAWITDAFTKQIPKYPNIEGWIWFNENKERDWRINSDPNSLAAFKAILP